jgi:hypothetical protein
MSVESAPYYWLTCDHVGCGVKSTKGGDYTAWGDESMAREEASCSDWIEVEGKDYCDNHRNQHDPELLAECDGSASCDSIAHVEGCFATNPDYKAAK